MNKDDNLRECSGVLTCILCDKTVSHEVSGDLTLPEHLPELRRLLSVSERVLPPAKYVSGSGVECNGSIDYTLLYVGADGGLYSAELSSEYELNVPIEQSADAMSDSTAVIVNTVSEGISARMTSQRRINIKNRLRSHVRAYGDMSVGESDFGGEDIQRLYKAVGNAAVYSLCSEPIELSDEIGGLYEDSRVISASASVVIGEMRRGSEGLDVSGDVLLKLLVCRDGGRAETLTKKIPFSGVAEGGDTLSNALCTAHGCITDITVNVEDRRALCNMTLVLSGVGVQDRCARYIADVYSTERECQCIRDDLCLPTARICAMGNFSQSERLSAADAGIPEGASVIDGWGSAYLDSCEYIGGRYVLSGKSKYSVLCEKDGEYSVANAEMPVKYEIEGDAADSICFDTVADVIACRVRIDGDTLGIDAEIAAYVNVMSEASASVVSEVRFGEAYGKKKCRMVVYYPADRESSWDVAKKYHVPADSIAPEKNYYLF